MRVFLKESNAWFLVERSSTDLRGWIKSKKRGESAGVRWEKERKEKRKKGDLSSFFLPFLFSLFF